MKAFIFDFDGVVVDSQKYWDEHTLHHFRTLIPHWNTTDNRKLRGMSVPDTYEMLRTDYGFSGERKDFLHRLDGFALELYQSKAQLIDGIQHLLDRLDALQIPIGIATASRSLWLHTALDLHGIRHRFAATTSEDQVSKSKPHPEVYIKTAHALGADPTQCVALEDSAQGLTSAKVAGMFAIALETPDHLHREEDISIADMVIHHPDELTEEVLRRL